jgi:hypothetical protein
MNYVLGRVAEAFGYVTSDLPKPPLFARIKLRIMQLAYDTAKSARRVLFPLLRR